MLKIAQSNRNRTCCQCHEEIPKESFHFELWGGPEKDYSGYRNGWVHFAHIGCVKSATSRSAIRAARRKFLREQRQNQGHRRERFWRS